MVNVVKTEPELEEKQSPNTVESRSRERSSCEDERRAILSDNLRGKAAVAAAGCVRSAIAGGASGLA